MVYSHGSRQLRPLSRGHPNSRLSNELYQAAVAHANGGFSFFRNTSPETLKRGSTMSKLLKHSRDHLAHTLLIARRDRYGPPIWDEDHEV